MPEPVQRHVSCHGGAEGEIATQTNWTCPRKKHVLTRKKNLVSRIAICCRLSVHIVSLASADTSIQTPLPMCMQAISTETTGTSRGLCSQALHSSSVPSTPVSPRSRFSPASPAIRSALRGTPPLQTISRAAPRSRQKCVRRRQACAAMRRDALRHDAWQACAASSRAPIPPTSRTSKRGARIFNHINRPPAIPPAAPRQAPAAAPCRRATP